MKGWLDNFGKANNANDSKVSMSEDFVGLGYNTEGRNYSPAWGGQFQVGGKLNPISPTQQIQQAVEPTPTVPYLQTKDPAEFYKSWIQSPEYARRQLLTGYSEGEDLYMPNAAASRESRLGAIEEMTPITYSARQPSEAKPGVYGSPSYVNINPSDYIDTSKEAIQAHELAHIAGAMGEVRPGMMSGTEQDIFKKSMLPMKEPVLSGVQGSKEREASVRALEDFKHSQEPDEAKADLDALRFMMYDKGIYDITKGKKFTETDFQKAKQNLGNDRVFKRLENRMGKKNFVKLMNTIASTDQEEAPIAMGGMSIPGSVGFTYARTAGSAPSEGKYAKKTMASAQNGIMSPMLLARNVLNYFYPNEEAAPAVEAVEAAPVNYKKGLTNELLQRQAYKESTFNPTAVSKAGYKGLTQIGESVLKDYSNKKGGKKLDPFNPEDAVELQKFAMDDLYNASFINKPNQPDSVRIAKTLAAYNWGRGNLANYLNEQKSKGVDIYDSYDWLNNLPKETSDYVNKIFLQEDPSFNKNYKKASTNPKYEEVTSLYDQKKFGGDIPSAQNGQEMKFYQNGLDWKPKSMQDGGVQRISTSDPRYAEMYKNRQVGAYYDGAYSLPDLDEVTITAPRSYTMDSLRDFTTAALYGAPANAMKLSMIPQAAMTEGIEALRGKPYDFSNAGPNLGYFISNQRDPSQTMGYENPEGFLQNAANIGLSMIDPLALVGAGGARSLTKPAQSSFGQLFRGIDPRNLKTQSGLDWSKQWYKHPEILQRKVKIASSPPSIYFDDKTIERFSNDFIENAKESLNQYEPKTYIDLLKDKGIKQYSEHALTSGGVSYGRPDQIYVNRAVYFPFDKKGLESVRTHELSHLVNRNGRGLTFNEEDMLLKPLGFEDNVIRLNKLEEIKSGSKKKWASYYTEPTEVKARMDQARFDLNLSPEDKFTPEMFDKISKKNNFYGMGKYIKDKDTFVELMNKFWAAPAVGVAVGAQEADQQKNGGITKDNQGYWNPDNWGKPVEIDSNDITMEGVYEPLLGVSDTGDTKLMKPGKNYKFKGKKVTEYPVAKLGINQLDAQPMKKLNQLLNFTNNPDKDNWLDKYN